MRILICVLTGASALFFLLSADWLSFGFSAAAFLISLAVVLTGI